MPSRRYCREHIEFIKTIAPGKHSFEILKLVNDKYPELEMTLSKLRSIMKNYKITNGRPKRPFKYTEEQLCFIRDNVVNPEKQLAKMFNDKFGTSVNVSIISNLKSNLGVKSGLIGGRFEKGQVPLNKGKHWSDFMSKEGQENSKKTCFKKGDIPKNHKPVGSERINIDGYIEIKVKEPNKWKLKHRVVYEEHFGKIPKGKNIIFLDGDKLNLNIDNLALVSLSENLIINKQGLRSDIREVTQSGVMLAKVIDKTNKLKR